MKFVIPILLLAGSLSFGQFYPQHRLLVEIVPDNSSLSVTDSLYIPGPLFKNGEVFFTLHNGLDVQLNTQGATLDLVEKNLAGTDLGMDREEAETAATIQRNRYRLKLLSQPKSGVGIVLHYTGKIHHPINQLGAEYARGFSQTPGIIDTQGVYLGGSSQWIPQFGENLVTFKLTTRLPAGWDVVSQGQRIAHRQLDGQQVTTWEESHPMEEVYLIAAKFSEYLYKAGTVDVMAFLRTPDENLANKYLETTAQYLEMYRKLIGPYPFKKFALVENFWETGYGMPSFTLLGQQIIRFPFILHSSYPHELLHNYWGNSVYVDFDSGNWCEGLTAYMADHLIKEQRGQGADYRRSTLQKFTDYVTPQNDFPLSQFISRHDAPSEAIGYGKSLMLWNMLRERLGDDLFVRGFQKFYRDNKFKVASYADIQKAFEQISDSDLSAFFTQWTTRTGAPQLELSAVHSKTGSEGYTLSFTLKQVQPEEPFALSVPVVITTTAGSEQQTVQLSKRSQNFAISVKNEPQVVEIDPQFQVMRRLHANEIPPALSKLFGAQKILMVLPSGNEAALYRQLAEIWSKDQTKSITIKSDSELQALPAEGAVWIFGNTNRYKATFQKSAADYDMEFEADQIRLGKTLLPLNNNSVIITARNPKNPAAAIALLTLHSKQAVPGLARKLPHYGKYSYLAFEGDEPTNVAKGQWPAVNSPLTFYLDTAAQSPALDKRKALAMLEPVFNASRMQTTINYLSSAKMKGRAPGTPEIDEAANFIAEQFKQAGLQPGADNGTYFQSWQAVVDESGRKAEVKNVVAVLPGSDPAMEGQSVVICAHYDHLGLGWPDARQGNKGKIHFGADDNASGVTVLLELAHQLGKTLKPKRSVVFVAFTLEEAGLVGSRYYVKHAKNYPAQKIIGALNLDTVGRLGKNKLLVLNTNSAREWKFIFMGAGYVTGVESEMVTQQLDASDQVAFAEVGVPAVQFFSGANYDYHRPTDTVDKIDISGMMKVAAYVREGLVYLSERPEALTYTGTSASQNHPGEKQQVHGAKPGSGKRATTGSMPDFAFNGTGVKIGAVAPDTPAAKAGLKKGDIIIRLGTTGVNDLRSYSEALKQHQPGEEVEITYLRDGTSHTVKLTLGAR